MQKALAVIVIALLLPGIAKAWEIKTLEYNTTTSVLEIDYKLNAFEGLISLALGGEFPKKITNNLVLGDYTLLHAGFTSVKLKPNGTIYFKEPVTVRIVGENESGYIANVTELKPLIKKT